MSSLIRILIAEDHAIVREGLRALIGGKPDMELVAEAVDGAQAVRQARALRPDVILMDLVMPGVDGLQAIREIRQVHPQARVLVLTSFGEDERVLSAIQAGAVGYLLKDISPEELIKAIRCVHRGQPALHPSVARTLLVHCGPDESAEPTAGQLSRREIQVLKLLARGWSNSQIARQLFVVEGTVRFHVSNILTKLNLENRIQAVLYALRHGLASLEE